MVSRSMSSSLVLSSAAFFFLVDIVSSATDMPTTCYVIDGKHNAHAGFRCNNQTTGHSSCCAIGGICYSNGVCQQSNSGVQDYLRVGCTDPTWQDAACLDQCTTYATDSTAGIRFCGAAITATTEYCCDNGTAGIGSFECCDTQTDLFAIQPVASFVAQIPLTYSSTSTSSSSTSTSASSSSSTSSSTTSVTTSPAATTSTASSSSNSHAAAIGAGVGVPVVILALAGIGYFFWRRGRNARKGAFVNTTHSDEYGQYTDNQPALQEAPGSIPMGTADPKKDHWVGRQYDPAPQEMPTNAVHEMPTDGR